MILFVADRLEMWPYNPGRWSDINQLHNHDHNYTAQGIRFQPPNLFNYYHPLRTPKLPESSEVWISFRLRTRGGGGVGNSTDPLRRWLVKFWSANRKMLGGCNGKEQDRPAFRAVALDGSSDENSADFGDDFGLLVANTTWFVTVRCAVSATSVDVDLYVDGVLESSASADNTGEPDDGICWVEIAGQDIHAQLTAANLGFSVSEVIVATHNIVGHRLLAIPRDTAETGSAHDWTGTAADIDGSGAAPSLSNIETGGTADQVLWVPEEVTIPSGKVADRLVLQVHHSRNGLNAPALRQTIKFGTLAFHGATVAPSFGWDVAVAEWASNPDAGGAWSGVAGWEFGFQSQP